MFRLHVIGNPYFPIDPNRTCDAYTEKIRKFCRLFNREHKVYYYGVEGNEKYVECGEFIPVISDKCYASLRKLTNNFTHPTYFAGALSPFEKEMRVLTAEFGKDLYRLIKDRYIKGDLVIHFCDSYDYDKYDLINIAGSNGGGYHKCFKYKVFETGSWLKNQMLDSDKSDSNILCTHIYPWFWPEDFPYKTQERRRKVYLYMARMTRSKGIHFFLEIVKYANQHDPDAEFWMAGGVDDYKDNLLTIDKEPIDLSTYNNLKYIGVLNGERRLEVLSEVSVLVQPTRYFEPCGWNVIEAMMMGTPVVAPKQGGFVETIIDKPNDERTGVLVDDLIDVKKWYDSIKLAEKIPSNTCRYHVLMIFSPEVAYCRYTEYFKQVLALEANKEKVE
jgi:glycosyltransferase involved in cell wall biosynthesis